MNMLDLLQGTPEWHAARNTRFCASDAAAMLGLSKNETRDGLLRLKKTGSEREFSEWAQRHLLDKGHEFEAAARAIAEQVIGEDLFPVVGVIEIDGMQLLASFDGLTMDDDTVWEHKMHAGWLAEYIETNGDLPDTHWPQVEHQLLVSGASAALFMTSDGTVNNEAHLLYRSRPERRHYLIDGWKQFQADLAAYVPGEIETKPVAAPIEALPSVHVQLTGAVSVQDNLTVFGQRLKDFIGRIKEKPQDDQDFADAEAAIKALSKAEEALKQAEASAMGQVEAVDELKRVIAAHSELARATRLRLEKLVKAEKENRRNQIMATAASALNAHVDALNAGFSRPYVPKQSADFATAIKGLKSIASIQNAVDTLLVKAKSDVTDLANKIRANINFLNQHAEGKTFLFADVAQLVLKDAETFELLVKSRLNEHEQAEAKRLDAERERIRLEEEARAQAKTASPAPAPLPATQAPVAIESANEAKATLSAVPTSATTTLGQISGRLGFAITAAFIAELGFESVGRERAAVLYRESDYPLICDALIDRIRNVRNQRGLAAA